MKIETLIAETQKLGEAVAKFLRDLDAEYAKPLISPDGLTDSKTAFQRGANVAKLTNELFGALVMWNIEAEDWRRSEVVKKIVAEYNEKHPETKVFFEDKR